MAVALAKEMGYRCSLQVNPPVDLPVNVNLHV